MKRLIQKFKKDPKGSVSIFFIIIVTGVFMFNAVLIDYSRALAADKQSEYAIQSAVRSALAAYDNELREFGLFGVEKDSIDFNDLLKKNIEADDDSFKFINPKVENAEIVYDQTRALAQPNILNAQILEEMKYKAPVEIVKEILEKFSFVSKAMKETSTFVNTASDITGDVENREKKLDQIPGELKRAKAEFQKVLNDLNTTSKAAYPSVANYNDIVANLSVYHKDKTEMDNLKKQIADLKKQKPESDEEKKAIQDQIDQLNKKLQDLSKNADLFKQNVDKKITELNKHLKDGLDPLNNAKKLLDEASALNQTIKNKIAKNRSEADKNYGDAIAVDKDRGTTPKDANQGGLDAAMGNLNKVSNQLDDFVYDPKKDGYDFFGDMSGYINTAISDVKKVPSFKVNLDTDSQSTLYKMKDAVKSSLNEKRINDALNYMNTKRKNINAQDKELMKKKKAEADQKAKEASEMFNVVPDDGDTYDKLSAFYDLYKQYAKDQNMEIVEEGKLAGPNLKGGGEAAGSDSMDMVDLLFKGLGSILLSARDRLYVNEYILMNFESAKPTSIFKPEDYAFKNREAEYILYGFHLAGANYTAALTQIFAIRLALRFIDALTQPSVLAATFPLAIFLAALAWSLTYAIKDVAEIGSGNDVPLISDTITPGPALAMGYRGYLRLFMFMNPSGNERLMRIMSVINFKKKIDLRERYTYVQGKLTMSTNLWFIPEIAKALSITGVMNGKVNDENRYEFTKEAYFSY